MGRKALDITAEEMVLRRQEQMVQWRKDHPNYFKDRIADFTPEQKATYMRKNREYQKTLRKKKRIERLAKK